MALLRFFVQIVGIFTVSWSFAQEAANLSQHDFNSQVLQQLNSKNLIGIEIILAGKSFRSAESAFGHCFLRFVTADGNPLDDIVVSFIADGYRKEQQDLKKKLENSQLSKWKTYPASVASFARFLYKGSLGHYWIGLNVSTLKEVIENYAAGELRTLQRFIVPTTGLQRAHILQRIEELNEGKLKTKYYFASFNCVVFIERLLQDAGLPYFMLDSNIPTEIGSYLNRVMWTPYPSVEMINLPAVVKKAVEALQQVSKEKSLTESDLLAALNKMDKLNLLRFYLLMSDQMEPRLVVKISDLIKSRPEKYTLDEIYGTLIFSIKAYDLDTQTEIETLPTYFQTQRVQHCSVMSSAIQYRQAYPMSDVAKSTYENYKAVFNSFCLRPN